MHLQCYIFTLAENDEDAKSNVRSWLDDYAGREFYDYAGLDEPETALLVKDIPATELEEAREETERLLPVIKNDIDLWEKEGNHSMEGYCHCRYGRILGEYLCSEMPYYNMDTGDWSIPDKVPDEAKGMNWYAVRANFHF
jgi:hypothetical protein